MNIELKHKLINLWFTYGNGGPKHSGGDHKFIQRHVEHIENNTQWTKTEKKQWKSFYKPSQECYLAIQKLLKEYDLE